MGNEHPSCPRCGSDETRRVTNYGRPVGNEWQCTDCKRRWEPENELTELRAENARLQRQLEQPATVIVHWPDGRTVTVPVRPGDRYELRPSDNGEVDGSAEARVGSRPTMEPTDIIETARALRARIDKEWRGKETIPLPIPGHPATLASKETPRDRAAHLLFLGEQVEKLALYAQRVADEGGRALLLQEATRLLGFVQGALWVENVATPLELKATGFFDLDTLRKGG